MSLCSCLAALSIKGACISTSSYIHITLSFPRDCCCPQHGARGYDKVEEYDPIERMKRLATGPAVDSMPSLEDELRTLHKTVDINKFDYKPVPRTDGDDEE